MKLRLFTLYMLFIVALGACQKDVEIHPITEFTGDLFIEGILFPGEKPRIYLSRASPFFDETVTPQEIFARGATIIISSNTGTEVLAPDSTFDKFRCRWVPFYGGQIPSQYGETYNLTVNFEGNTYTAANTLDQVKAEIESVEYIAEFFDIYGGHDGVVIKFTDVPGPGNFYRYQMNRMIDKYTRHVDVLENIGNDCAAEGELFPVTDLGRSIFSDENVDGQQLTLFIEVSFEYEKDDSTYVYLQSLDKNSAEFYKELDEQLLARVNPFVEPVFLNSKIDGAIGVFGSAVRSDSVLFIYPVTED